MVRWQTDRGAERSWRPTHNNRGGSNGQTKFQHDSSLVPCCKGWREQAMSTAGLSQARLGRMHDVMVGYVERGDVPGLVTLVSRRGEVHLNVIGTQAIGESLPMQRDTIFRISSMTKPITAAA